MSHSPWAASCLAISSSAFFCTVRPRTAARFAVRPAVACRWPAHSSLGFGWLMDSFRIVTLEPKGGLGEGSTAALARAACTAH
eukprot:1985071-Lingulodinium_polyedra.AAC.1